MRVEMNEGHMSSVAESMRGIKNHPRFRMIPKVGGMNIPRLWVVVHYRKIHQELLLMLPQQYPKKLLVPA